MSELILMFCATFWPNVNKIPEPISSMCVFMEICGDQERGTYLSYSMILWRCREMRRMPFIEDCSYYPLTVAKGNIQFIREWNACCTERKHYYLQYYDISFWEAIIAHNRKADRFWDLVSDLVNHTYNVTTKRYALHNLRREYPNIYYYPPVNVLLFQEIR